MEWLLNRRGVFHAERVEEIALEVFKISNDAASRVLLDSGSQRAISYSSKGIGLKKGIMSSEWLYASKRWVYVPEDRWNAALQWFVGLEDTIYKDKVGASIEMIGAFFVFEDLVLRCLKKF